MLSLEQLSGAKITYAADQPDPLSGVTRIEFNGKKTCVVQAKVRFLTKSMSLKYQVYEP